MKIAKYCSVLPAAAFLCFTVSIQAQAPKMDTPSITCGEPGATTLGLVVTGGPNTGAPAGFVVEWVSAADYAANSGWPPSGGCSRTFSPGDGYALAANASVNIVLGDEGESDCSGPLLCGTDYVVRCYALFNDSNTLSDRSDDLPCGTLDCDNPDPGCTFTQGYWKTHGPTPTGKNANVWPVTGLTLGNVFYTDAQCLQIFNQPVKGNGLVSLAHQLMAAKLNVANGADDSAIASTIIAADAMIGNLKIPPVAGAGSLPASTTSALAGTLGSYNEGIIGPGHCDE